MWMNPHKFGALGPMPKPVEYTSLSPAYDNIRKLGFIGFAYDEPHDRKWLVHANSLWFQLTKDVETGTWGARIGFYG